METSRFYQIRQIAGFRTLIEEAKDGTFTAIISPGPGVIAEGSTANEVIAKATQMARSLAVQESNRDNATKGTLE
jgi:hypothetical protein